MDTEQQIESLLKRMTLEEKISLCHAGSKFSVSGIARLGIPELTMSDGPHGVRREITHDSWDFVNTDTDYATYLPTGSALAATWNLDLAQRFGEVLGAEARHRGKDVILGPGVNIARIPICGRNFEYYGEDPFHVAAMTVPVIQGIQSQDVAACVKHFAANSQELNRSGVDARMDERTLREIYLPAFHAAVTRGGALTVMGAYNKFRGQYCCHNECLVNGILKDEWKFQGTYISDWGGTHDTLEAARYGLDIEMGTTGAYGDYYLANPFRHAIESGELDVALVDDKVRRVLRVMARIGRFRPDRKPGERNTRKHQAAALEIAREAIVLLKNEGSVLPLDPRKMKRLLVIGDNATEKHALGGNSSAVKALYEVTPLEGLRSALGDNVEIVHFRGYPPAYDEAEPIKAEYLGVADEAAGTNGWKGFYYTDREGAWTGSGLQFGRPDAAIDFDWSQSAPIPGQETDQYSVRWETTITPPQTGEYQFVLNGANHAVLVIDDMDLIQRWENGGPEEVAKSVRLQAGRAYRAVIRVRPGHKQVRIRLGWIVPGTERHNETPAEIFQAAENADAVLFFGGLDHQYDVEGLDRSDMALHDGQNELLEQIAGINPNTVVILVSGSPVEMPWIDRLPAVVQMWYAGMEGGHAIADVLLGKSNPSGKLPVTFPRRLLDSPAHALGDYGPEICHYSEGIFVGYRWFDAKGIEPLFPFGHGLSYSHFSWKNLQVSKKRDGVRVRLELTNTGQRAGAEVVQLYVSQRNCAVLRPVRELKGFAKVFLAPGETRGVDLWLEPSAFAYWSAELKQWTIAAGEYVIEVGASSRDLRLRRSLWVDRFE